MKGTTVLEGISCRNRFKGDANAGLHQVAVNWNNLGWAHVISGNWVRWEQSRVEDSTRQQCGRCEGRKVVSRTQFRNKTALEGERFPFKTEQWIPPPTHEAVVPRGFILNENKSFCFSVFFFSLPYCVFSAQGFRSVVRGLGTALCGMSGPLKF